MVATPVVPPAAIVAATGRGRLEVLDAHGRVLRAVPGALGSIQGIAVARDRRHAYVSVYVPDLPSRLYLVDLSTGRKRFVAYGLSPALSPDGTRLAYLATVVRDDIKLLTQLVVRDLGTGGMQTYALGPRIAVGTPPELVLGWSPSSRSLAFYDGAVLRIVLVPRRGILVSRRVVGRGVFAPVFADAHTLVVDANCCIGGQRLAAIDLRTGKRSAFATVSSPLETASRLRSGTVVATTALDELVLVSRGRVQIVARGITAASP